MGRMMWMSVWHTKLQKSHNHACYQSDSDRPQRDRDPVGLAVIPDGRKQNKWPAIKAPYEGP
jgi:hypothetical protein